MSFKKLAWEWQRGELLAFPELFEGQRDCIQMLRPLKGHWRKRTQNFWS